MTMISASVGAWEKGAVNLRPDVETVQKLLKAASEVNEAFDPGEIDGKIARSSALSSTVKAIKAFQLTFMKEPDGMVEPGKTTIKRLANLPLTPPPAIPPPPATVFSRPACFPLPFFPKEDYHKSRYHSRWYGANRDGGRWHAGCDLIANEGSHIYAVDDGVVRYASDKGFYFKTDKDTGKRLFDVGEIQIRHPEFLARYCEIKGLAPGIRNGVEVRKGQLIAFVGRMRASSMLHFELYQGLLTGKLTVRNGKGPKRRFQRRDDLLDPTPYLDIWKQNLPTE
jgi:murein DD-endopeptidase MepM/ murein hydrolase activator NlpD